MVVSGEKPDRLGARGLPIDLLDEMIAVRLVIAPESTGDRGFF